MATRRRRSQQIPGNGAELRLFALAVAVAALLVAVGAVAPAAAQEQEELDTRWDSEKCLGCHEGKSETLTLSSGEQIGLDVNGDAFRSGPHVDSGVQCAHCHTTIARFPHPDSDISDARSYTVELSKSCNVCHWRESTIRLDNAHAFVPVAERAGVPVCADCHEAHAARAVPVNTAEAQATCDQCHTEERFADVEAIHVLTLAQGAEANPPPLVLFYALIMGAIITVVGLAWAGVVGVQWLRRRLARSA